MDDGRQRRAKKRTWTLGTLDRSKVYKLWFDETHYRWEVIVDEGWQAFTPEGIDRGLSDYPQVQP